MTVFTGPEADYLGSQRIGRLATVDADGQPQANPVAFFLNEDGTLDIGGFAMGRTKKWRNAGTHPKVALVVDSLVSEQPWMVCGVEIRGEAERRIGPHDLGAQLSDEVIRIHPRWVYSWGLEDVPGATSRAVG
ncbi:PPOX class F420-dependent oxidoreductase [Streptomyces sp. 4503]|uniref:PPOX class F420-dependent oxidoreductase n=1 Tax=Streptomyces niphimycinicus TaxID=2842201 RepID=A0ABS6CC24_9ACTN|nr:PPOX class F420-dependent oxidoreductase [Streptomyces niphimycinicus]MBU3864330.1 PPOX class F420-dependent oxidoreductase [Streptomyces niphimycinicus]